MATSGPVETACRLAHDFYRRRDVSVVGLLRESGHRDDLAELTVEEIADCLRANPEWQEAWMVYSGDQRVDRGWFVAEEDSGGCVVGEFPGETRTHFDDCSLACAEFVRRQVQEIVDSSTF